MTTQKRNRASCEYKSMSRISESNKQVGNRKGAWTHEEDVLLKKCIEKYGEGKWRQVPLRAGLRRCRKSCRLRWLNYLQPGIKRGDFANDEVDLIMRLHRLLGNKWSLIAGRIPGRTANDIKNYWNSHIKKKLASNVKMETKTTIMTTKTSKDKLPSPSTCTLIRPQPRKLSALNRLLPVTTTLPTNAMSNGIEQDHVMKSLSSICEFDDGCQSLTSTTPDEDSFERFWEKEMGGLGLEDMLKHCDDLEL